MAWSESRGIWALNCCILAEMSSVFFPFIGDNSRKTSLSTEPGTVWSSALHNPTVLLRSVQLGEPSSCVLQPSSDKWLHSHIPDFTSGSPTWTQKQIQMGAEAMWDPGPPARPHKVALLSCNKPGMCPHLSCAMAPGQDRAARVQAHTCHPLAQPAEVTAVLECWVLECLLKRQVQSP